MTRSAPRAIESEREGQRREPAADDVRFFRGAERLAPVRWTVWFAFLGLAFFLDRGLSGAAVSTILTATTSPTFRCSTDFQFT